MNCRTKDKDTLEDNDMGDWKVSLTGVFFRVNISLNDRSIVEFALELEDGRKASRGPF